MASPKLSKFDLHIMRALWDGGALSIREIQESFPQRTRPAYSTVQTTVYRLESKGALRRARKISNAHIFEALISRNATQRRLIEEFLALFSDGVQPVMSYLIGSGKLTLQDIQEAERVIRDLRTKEAPPKS